MYRRGVPSFSTGCSGCLFFSHHLKIARTTSTTLEGLKRFSSPEQRIIGLLQAVE